MKHPSLRWRDVDGIVQRQELGNQRLMLGRRADSDIVLSAPEVSRRHAAIVIRDGQVLLEDLGSSHGTYVKGVRIYEQPLRVGDRFSIVDTEFEVLPPDDGVTKADPLSETSDSVTEFMNLTMAQTEQVDERSGLAKLSALLDLEYRWKKKFPAEELFRQILESGLEVSGALRAFIYRRAGDRFVLAQGLNAEHHMLTEDDFQISSTLLREVVESRSPVFETTGLDSFRAGQESIVLHGVKALACLPLMGIRHGSDESDVIGVLYLDSTKPMHTLSGLDEKILRKLAAETGNVVEKMELIRTLEEAKRYEKELKLAQEAQEHLLPRRNPSMSGYRIASFCKPTRYVGGDFYDFQKVGEALHLILADVSGKGISASLLSASLQSALHMQLRKNDPSTALHRVNNYLFERTEESRFATLGMLRVTEEGRCSYWSAGHIPTYWYRAASDTVEELQLGGTLVGMFEDESYSQQDFEMQDGDVVFVLSDGLTEAQRADGDMFEEERLKELIARHGSEGVDTLMQKVLEAVEDFVEGHEQSDDLTMLLIERGGTPS